MKLIPLTILFVTIGSSVAFQCHSYSEYSGIYQTLDNRQACLSVFADEEDIGAFGGLTQERIQQISGDIQEGCVEKTVSFEDEEPMKFHVCVCLQSLCNTPMSFNQFQANGYKLSKSI